MAQLFQSTRPVWGATNQRRERRCYRMISIHAPRMGRDGTVISNGMLAPWISIHAPRMGRDRSRCMCGKGGPTFQSTRPVWGATTRRGIRPRRIIFQSTRPVWGATAKLHNFPVQFCARVTVNTMPQTILRQNMPAASFKLQERTQISGAKPPEKVCQLALRIQTISTPSGS